MFRRQMASIIGHDKSTNQDAYGTYESSKYLVSIVADGLGSSKYSEIGSVQAVRSVKKAVVMWRSLKKEDSKILLQLVHFYWNLSINDLDLNKKDCLTTCLFIYIDKVNNKGLLCQMGDGMICYKSEDYFYVTSVLKDFNYTKALGSSKKSDDWIVKSVKTKNARFFLATDGISDDIVEGKEDEFLDYMIKNMNDLKARRANSFLKETLKKWPTKFHIDDKTICIGWRK